ncbi:MAG: dihydropteroate synthase [Bifidobacteriaceae bacterium]|jgi:dihydropteroate synthase|nr:dihydropteroate synthase [Bifidobacteriaceae bacterium]
MTPPAFRRPAPLPEALAGLGRCAVMGIVNVTPDSFSDGGMWDRAGRAVAHGLELAEAGADLIDVGGESTRPGAARVDRAEEARRVLPVVRALAARGVAVSVDTMRAAVARGAVEAGAVMVNDVSGGLADPAMAETVAELGVVYAASHWRGHSDGMDARDSYGDVVEEVAGELEARLGALTRAGVRPERIVLDPGLGFAKAGASNWPLLAGLGRLAELGRPVLVGASRKRFLGAALAGAGGAPRPPLGLDAATAAVSALAAAAGAWCVRVHAVGASADAVRVADHWRAIPRNDPALGQDDAHGTGRQ